MAKAKNLVYGYTTGSTIYAVIVRAEDGYVLDSTDGTFKANLAACTDPYCDLAESATIIGRYSYSTSAAVWNDGPYTATIYLQAGGSPAIATDTVLDTANIYIAGDAAAAAAAPSAGALCTLAAVKAALNIPTATTSKDALISSLIDSASSWIEKYCDRTFTSTTHTEYFSPGRDKRVRQYRELIPRQWPIISITSIREDDDRAFSGADTLLAATDYWNDDVRVYLYQDADWVAFAYGERTVQLVYVAGYATIPEDLQRAAVMLTVKLFYDSDRQKQGIASESLGGTTITYVDDDVPKSAKAILDLYRRPCMAV